MTDWVPVVDMATHQGSTDFPTMKAKGVRGLILRIAHGLTLDSRVETYYPYAVAAGFAPADIGFYPFINPKRGTAADTATFAVEAIKLITFRDDFLYMLDVENYANESPNVGQAPVFGPQFAAYIREHIANVKALAPKARVIGYTNRSYWNGKIYKGSTIEWVGDDALAGELDWIVARYPAYSEAAYANKPLPTDTRGWADWAFKAAPDGPFPPRGATWKAWQFSAGFNRQGPAYGVSSPDLDLNIVHPEAWAKWTATPLGPPTENPHPLPPPNPQPEDDMAALVTNTTNTTIWIIRDDDGFRRQISPQELRARGGTPVVWTDAELAQVPEYTGPPPLAVDYQALAAAIAPLLPLTDDVARDMAARNATAISDIRMGGQRIADAGGQ